MSFQMPIVSAAASGGDIGAADIGSVVADGTAGSILFVDAAGQLAQDNDKLFWDAANFRLGVGTATPTSQLEVVGASLFTGNVVLGDEDGAVTARADGTLRASHVAAGGAGNVAGADLYVQAGKGSGTGDVGQIIFQTPRAAAAGDNLQSLTTLLTLDEATATFAGVVFSSAAGSAAAPSVAVGSVDNGLYRTGGGSLAFTVTGVARAYITTDGLVPASDNTRDLGQANATWQDGFFGTSIVLGLGDTAATATTSGTFRAANVAAGGDGDIAGADLTIAAGLGTGTGDVGTIIFQTPRVAGAGDNIQSLTTVMTLDGASIDCAGNILGKGGGVFSANAWIWNHDVPIVFGTSQESALSMSSTQTDNSTTVWGLADSSKSIVFTTKTNYTTTQSFDHGSQSHPTIFVHSATAPDTANNQWVSLSANASHGVIDAGLNFQLKQAGNTVVSSSGTDFVTASNIYLGGSLNIAGAGDRYMGGATAEFESAYVENFVTGRGDGTADASTDGTVRVADVYTGGAGNVAGADLYIRPGLGTGTGDVGTIIFQTPRVGAAGDNAQSTTTLLTLDAANVLIDGNVYVNAGILALIDNNAMVWGSGGDTRIDWSTSQTNDAAMWGLGASNYMCFTAYGLADGNYAHANQTNPMAFVHSATAAASATDEWIGIAHNVTDAVIDWGSGTLDFAGGSETASTLTHDGHWIVKIGGVEKKIMLGS